MRTPGTVCSNCSLRHPSHLCPSPIYLLSTQSSCLLAVSSKGYLTMLLQGMLQEQHQHGETKLRNLVSYHLVLYDVGTVLSRIQPQLPAARVPSCFSKAVYDHGERSCTRNDLDPNIYAIWACQLSFSLSAFDEMHGYLTCRVRVSVQVSPLTTTADGPADCSLPCGLLRRPDHATMAARYAKMF